MGLEDLTGASKYISDLINTNPVGASDPKSAGDDHIRGIKNVILNTFANVAGAVTATHTELNYTDVTTLGTQEASKCVTTDANVNSGISKITELHIGVSGSETQVTSTAAELNILDGVTADKDELNLNDGMTAVVGGGTKFDALADATEMVFHQAAAPTGWTKSAANDDKALRVVSGATGGTSGGTHPLSTPPDLAHTHATPTHQHGLPFAFPVGAGYTNVKASGVNIGANISATTNAIIASMTANTQVGPQFYSDVDGSGTSGSTDPTSFAPEYTDVIVCAKDA